MSTAISEGDASHSWYEPIKRDQIQRLPRPDSPVLSNQDIQSRYTIDIHLENFRSWLFNEVLQEGDGNEKLASSVAWARFAKTIESMGYLSEDHTLLDAERKMFGKAFRAGQGSVQIDRNDFDVDIVNRHGESETRNLFDILAYYLGEQVKNKSFPLETQPINGRHPLTLYFLSDVRKISKADERTLLVAAPFTMPVAPPPQPKPAARPPVEATKLEPVKVETQLRPAKHKVRWDNSVDDIPKPKPAPKINLSELSKSAFRITHATTQTFVRSAVGGALLTTASRIAIVGGLGLFGVGAVPAGIGAGLAIGAWKVYSNYKKHGSGVQAAFGAAATVGGVALGAVGIDALIEPFKETLEPLAQQFVVDPLRDYVIVPAATAIANIPNIDVSGTIASAWNGVRQAVIDPVGDFFKDRNSLREQIEQLKQENALLKANPVTGAEAGSDEIADAIKGDSNRQEPRPVRTVTVRPDGTIVQPADITIEGTPGPQSDAGKIIDTSERVSSIAPAAFTTHTIGGNDSLYKVVKTTYGVEGSQLQDAMKRVITANPSIANNPSMLRDGLVLKLPTDLSTVAAAECDSKRLMRGLSRACRVPAVS